MQNLQEYARNRWKQAKIDGVCINHTNRSARLGFATCEYCFTRSRAKRQSNQNRGMCLNHKDKPAIVGLSKCLECQMFQRIRYLMIHGLDDAQLNLARAALNSFNGYCQSCGREGPGAKIGWCLDHDDINKLFRGIICHRCNTAIGLSGDSPERLKAMAQYLLTRSLKLETIIFAEAA